MARRPLMNYAILAANVVLFVMGINGMEGAQHRADAWMLHPEDLHLYQFFTSVFLHGSWMHLIGNMIFLWVFGNAINDRLGAAGYLAFYLAAGVMSGVGYCLFSGQVPALGASGAISGVAGAYLVLLPRARVTVIVLLFYMILPFELSSLYFILLQVAFNVVNVLAEMEGRSSGVALWAHLSGYAFGIAVAAALLAVRLLPRDRFDLLNLFRARHRREQFRRIVGQGYDPFGHGRAAAPDSSRRVSARKVNSSVPEGVLAREIVLRREIAEACARTDLAAAAAKYLQLVQIAPEAVLPRKSQLDVANQLMATDRHAEAADAYQRFLRHYGSFEHTADIHLMLGLLYGRYLQQPQRAIEYLESAAKSLRDGRKVELARSEADLLRRGGAPPPG